jgi:hypothetical protein
MGLIYLFLRLTLLWLAFRVTHSRLNCMLFVVQSR